MEPIFLLAVALACIALFRWTRRRSSLPLPPGPRGYPFIGSLPDLPSVTPWKAFLKWAQIYGDVMYINLPNQPTVVLSSTKAAFDLLEKRSEIYSDRPLSASLSEAIALDFSFGEMPYSPQWRHHRREFHQFFNQQEIRKYQSVQLEQTHAFLRRVLVSPENLGQNVRQIAAGTILKIVYGMEISDMFDEYVLIAGDAIFAGSVANSLGSFWAKYFPILRYIPSWVPGNSAGKFVDHYKPIVERVRDETFAKIKHDMAKGTASPSVTVEAIERSQQRFGTSESHDPDVDGEAIARNITSIAYAAASDTTAISIQTFLLSMSLYPETQKRAQRELDQVVGPNRLPNFDDYDQLIYSQAILLESMRWMVVLPLGVFHSVTRDDEYQGYLIPKGSTIITNTWAMLHDPEDYPDPFAFKPERFIKDGKLDPTVLNPLKLAFGFGRRICPGRHLAESSVFIAIASILHIFNVRPTDEGKKIDPFSNVRKGSIAAPDSVDCILAVRSEDARQLIVNS